MKSIIVGIDASDRAPLVFRKAVEVAKNESAKLIVIRAVGVPVEFPIEALSTAPDALPSLLLSATQRGLDHFVATHAGESKSLIERVEARLGTPWQVLCDAAKEFSADLVIVGSHGYGILDRLIGTTAARVANHAECSVLVVRSREGKEKKS